MARNMTTSWLASLTVAAACGLLSGCMTDPGVTYANKRDAAIAKQRAAEQQGLPRSTEQESIQRVLRSDNTARKAYQRLSESQARAAYRDGVRDTMSEFRGRMNATKNFVWRKPIVDTVRMPSRVVNGALVPAHMEPVLISPGEWQERNSVALPQDPYGQPQTTGDAR